MPASGSSWPPWTASLSVPRAAGPGHHRDSNWSAASVSPSATDQGPGPVSSPLQMLLIVARVKWDVGLFARRAKGGGFELDLLYAAIAAALPDRPGPASWPSTTPSDWRSTPPRRRPRSPGRTRSAPKPERHHTRATITTRTPARGADHHGASGGQCGPRSDPAGQRRRRRVQQGRRAGPAGGARPALEQAAGEACPQPPEAQRGGRRGGGQVGRQGGQRQVAERRQGDRRHPDLRRGGDRQGLPDGGRPGRRRGERPGQQQDPGAGPAGEAEPQRVEQGTDRSSPCRFTARASSRNPATGRPMKAASRARPDIAPRRAAPTARTASWRRTQPARPRPRPASRPPEAAQNGSHEGEGQRDIGARHHEEGATARRPEVGRHRRRQIAVGRRRGSRPPGPGPSRPARPRPPGPGAGARWPPAADSGAAGPARRDRRPRRPPRHGATATAAPPPPQDPGTAPSTPPTPPPPTTAPALRPPLSPRPSTIPRTRRSLTTSRRAGTRMPVHRP